MAASGKGTMNTTTSLRRHEAFNDFADQLNELHAAGRKLRVNGREVKSWSRTTAATVWQNGTLSVDVRTVRRNGVTQLWFKEGAELPTLTVED